MSRPMALPEPGAVSPGRRIITWWVIGAARALALLPPRRIRAVLAGVARRARPASYAEAKSARETVTAVSLLCAGRQGCLPRSIATVLLCRLRGAVPTWRVGVRTAPFSAHAWVEAEGQPVEEPAGTEHLRVLMTIQPSATEVAKGRSPGAPGTPDRSPA